MESGSGLKTTITGETQTEIIGLLFLLRKIVLMSSSAIRRLKETESLFKCVFFVVGG